MHHWYQRHQWQICHRCQQHRRQIYRWCQIHRWKIATGINKIAWGKFATNTACVVDTGGKFATGVNDTGGK
jgi:hypothetical protein